MSQSKLLNTPNHSRYNVRGRKTQIVITIITPASLIPLRKLTNPITGLSILSWSGTKLTSHKMHEFSYNLYEKIIESREKNW